MQAPLVVFLCVLALVPAARSGFWSDIGDFFSDIGEGIVDVVEDVGEGIADFAGGVVDTVEDVVETVEDNGFSLGAIVEDIFDVSETVVGHAAGGIAELAGYETEAEQLRDIGSTWEGYLGFESGDITSVGDKAAQAAETAAMFL